MKREGTFPYGSFFVEVRSHPPTQPTVTPCLSVAVCGTRELANRDPVLGARACVCVCQALSACVYVYGRVLGTTSLEWTGIWATRSQVGGFLPSRCAYDKDLRRTQGNSGISGVMALVLERVPFLVQLTIFGWAHPPIPSNTCKRNEMTGECPGRKDAMGEPPTIQCTK